MRVRGNSTYRAFNAPCRGAEASVIHIHYLYSQGAKPLIYTELFMGGCIQKNISDMYTGRTITPLYREDDPTSIQKEPSWALNEVTIDWSSEITTEACRQSWVLVRAINPRCCFQAVDIDGFLLKFGVFFFCAVNVLSEVCWQHLTGRIQHYQTCFSFNEWGVRGVLLFFLSKPS